MIENLWIILRFLSVGILMLNVSLEDYRHYRIPGWSCLLLGCIGILDSIWMERSWMDCTMGFFAVSTLLMIFYISTRGKGIGGGDIKLMAVSGILLGWMGNILAFILACFFVVVFYPLRKTFFPLRKRLALGPYLSLGIMLSLLWGNNIIQAYLSWSGI